ncbi:MAG: 2-oxoacid:acceptor oxidoreductase subunit alpha, partial [Alphaproteobacteria bacterium]
IGVELPFVIVNVQRAGPSTGMPTKTEQSDLLQAVYGRNGDSPLAVLAARSPADCFDTTIEACRLAVKYMTPVIVLSDGYIANAAEPAQIPKLSDYARFPARFHTDPDGFHPFLRDADTLAPVWAVPGTPGLQHRLGSLERDFDSGHISLDPANHQRMTDTRKAKIARIADDIPAQTVEDGDPGAALCVVGWGSTYGAIARAVSNLRAGGADVAHVHLRHINPFPANLGELLGGFGKVVVAEMNTGQLSTVLRAEYLLPVIPVTKVQGQPFKIAEIETALAEQLES